jgi:hypothetical protein
MKTIQIAFAAILVASIIVGSAVYMGSLSTGQSPPISSGAVKNYGSLVDALRAKGLKVEPAEKISQPFFAIEARTISVNAQTVQVFEYDSDASMNRDAAKVSPDGSSVDNSMISWVEPPHFYKAGRIIVLYVGKDPTVLRALGDVIGPQFAGREGLTSKRPEEAAKDFIVNAPTFKFDGIPESLNVTSAIVLESYPPQYITTITFESRHAGYGDRSGRVLAQVITKHIATVRVVEGNVISAVLDNQWDEINQKNLP